MPSAHRRRNSLERPLLSDPDGLHAEAAELSPHTETSALVDDDHEHAHRATDNSRADDDGYEHDYEHRTRSRLSFADMMPTTRDQVSLAFLTIGIALFLPLTLALVFSADVRALGWFAPHPPLNALAITMFTLGIAPVQPPTPPSGIRAARLGVHQRILLGIALPAMTAGTTSMFINKSVHGAQHFTTWHARCGILTVLWMWVQAALGAGSVWFGGRLFGGGAKAKAVYKYHRASGYALVTLSFITAALAGLYSTWAVNRGPQFVKLRIAAYAVGLPLMAAGLWLRVRPSKMKFT